MCAYKWVHYRAGDIIPNHAIKGGEDLDGSTIYVGRARFHGDLLPAKVIPARNTAYVCHGGEERTVDVCEVLVQAGFHWVPASYGNVPINAIPAGETNDGEILYIGRVQHNGTITIGKVHPSHSCCYIPYDSCERKFEDYEVLVCHF